ncbi:hypothetical protein H4R35_003922 [Dimargaris xerosporica]|nr:hypothetical protein H4R35_003922 [Dimargaris xerosporica]
MVAHHTNALPLRVNTAQLSRSNDDQEVTSPTLTAADQMQPPRSATSVPRTIPMSGPAAQRRASIHALTGWSSLYAHPTMAGTKPHENASPQARVWRTGSLGGAFSRAPATATGPPPPLFATSLPSPSQRTAFPPGLYHPPASTAKDATPAYPQNVSTSPPAPFSGIPAPFRRMSYTMGAHPASAGTTATADNQLQSRPMPLDGQPSDTNGHSPTAPSLSHYRLATDTAPSSAGLPAETSPSTWDHSAAEEGAKARKIRRIRTQPPRPESPMGKMILSGQFLD